MDASLKDNIDAYYDKWSTQLTDVFVPRIRSLFNQCVTYVNDIQLDFDKFRIKGVSHYYALLGFAYYCVENNISVETICGKTTEFYEALRGPNAVTGNIQAYKESMQSNTRYKGQRIRRINALKLFCGL